MKALVTCLYGNDVYQGNDLSILRGIKELPVEIKMAIELHFLEGLTRNQIASRLNWSLGKVNQKITRGITLLKMQLNPEYFQEADKIIGQTAQRLLSR